MHNRQSHNLLIDWIKRLTQQLNEESVEYPGGFIGDAGGAIDDGQYGDPMVDTRPDFVKADTEGWEPLR